MSKTFRKASKKGNYKKNKLNGKKSRFNPNHISNKKNRLNLLSAVEEEYLELVNPTDVFEEDFTSEELIPENEIANEMESEIVDNLDLESENTLETEVVESYEEEQMNDEDSNYEANDIDPDIDAVADDVIFNNPEETNNINEAALLSEVEQTINNDTDLTSIMENAEDIKNESIDSDNVEVKEDIEEAEILEKPEVNNEITAMEASESVENENNEFTIDEIADLLSSDKENGDADEELTLEEMVERYNSDLLIQDTDDQLTLEQMTDYYLSEEQFKKDHYQNETEDDSTIEDIASEVVASENEIGENNDVITLDDSATEDDEVESAEDISSEQMDEESLPNASQNSEETYLVKSEEDAQEDLRNEEDEQLDVDQNDNAGVNVTFQVKGGLVELKVKSFEQGQEKMILASWFNSFWKLKNEELKNESLKGEDKESPISVEDIYSEDNSDTIASNTETETSDSNVEYNSNSNVEDISNINSEDNTNSNSEDNSNSIDNQLSEEDIDILPEIKDSDRSVGDVNKSKDKCECKGCLFHDQSHECGNDEAEESNADKAETTKDSTCLCNLDCPNYPKVEAQSDKGSEVPSEETSSSQKVDKDMECIRFSDNTNSNSSSKDVSSGSLPVLYSMEHSVFGNIEVVASASGKVYYNAVDALKSIGVSKNVIDNLPEMPLQQDCPQAKVVLIDEDGKEYVKSKQYWPVSLILKTALEDQNRKSTEMTRFSLNIMYPLFMEILGIRKDYSDLEAWDRTFANKMNQYLWKVFLHLPTLLYDNQDKVNAFNWSE